MKEEYENIEKLSHGVYHILTRREIKRSNPPDKYKILDTIERKLKEGKPIVLVGLWGAQKDNSSGHADKADKQTLENIANTVKEIELTGVEAQVNIFFADLHVLSPYLRKSLLDREKFLRYRKEIKDLALGKNIKIKSLAESVYGFTFDDLYAQPKAQDNTQEDKLLNYFSPQASLYFFNLGLNFWQNAESNDRESILQAARRASRDSAQNVERFKKFAIQYCGHRIFESNFLKDVYNDGIFFGFGRPIYELYPPKTIFWFSVKKGVSKPPWMIDNLEEKII